jgi:hypothetical protein
MIRISDICFIRRGSSRLSYLLGQMLTIPCNIPRLLAKIKCPTLLTKLHYLIS